MSGESPNLLRLGGLEEPLSPVVSKVTVVAFPKGQKVTSIHNANLRRGAEGLKSRRRADNSALAEVAPAHAGLLR